GSPRQHTSQHPSEPGRPPRGSGRHEDTGGGWRPSSSPRLFDALEWGDPAATQGRVTDMTDAFALTEDQELFRREWRRLFEEKFTERAAEIDRTGEFPWDNLKGVAEAGQTGVTVPRACGGAGADSIPPCLLVEEVARICASPSLIPAVNKLATLPLLFAGTEEQK